MRSTTRSIVAALAVGAALVVPASTAMAAPAVPAVTQSVDAWDHYAGPYETLDACQAGRDILLMNDYPYYKLGNCILLSWGGAIFGYND